VHLIETYAQVNHNRTLFDNKNELCGCVCILCDELIDRCVHTMLKYQNPVGTSLQWRTWLVASILCVLYPQWSTGVLTAKHQSMKKLDYFFDQTKTNNTAYVNIREDVTTVMSFNRPRITKLIQLHTYCPDVAM